MPESFLKACSLNYESTSVPVRVIDELGQVVFSCPLNEEAVEPSEFNRELIENYFAQTKGRDVPVVKLVEELFFYAICPVQFGLYLLVGPVAPLPFSRERITNFAIFLKIDQNRYRSFIDNALNTPVMYYRRFLACVSVWIYLYDGRLLAINDMILSENTADTKEREKTLTNRLFDLREQQLTVHTPYSYEQGILRAVSEGNEAKLKQRLYAPLSGSIGQMSASEVQQQRYTFVTFTALVTRAAIQGGVPPEVAFSMSDLFIQSVDKIKSPESFASVTVNMAIQFTRKVAEVKGKAELSGPVRVCIEAIDSRLHEAIYIRDLAKLVNMTSRSLARAFIDETGTTILEYIHREKMNEAKSLLRHTEYSISQIGSFLQYNSQSYFTTVFKRICGVTPQQYRESTHGPPL